MSKATLSLFDTPAAAEPSSPAKIRAIAGFLAGWRWPGAGSYERLPKKKRDAAERAAAEVERFLAEGDGT